MDLQTLYQELIIDHGTQPRNCCALPNANRVAEGFNPLCGDKVNVYLLIEDDKITNASFTGKGCAISTASASLMTETLIGKTLKEAQGLFAAFKASLILDEIPDEISHISLGKLAALNGVKAFPARVKCATLAWHTLQAAIENKASLELSD